MFEIAYNDLLSGSLNAALARLSKQKGSVEAVFNLMRIQRKFAKEITNARELHTKITDAYFEKVDGVLVPSEHPTPLSPYKVIAGKEEEFKAEIEKFLALKVPIESYKINLADFPKLELTADEVQALLPVLVEVVLD